MNKKISPIIAFSIIIIIAGIAGTAILLFSQKVGDNFLVNFNKEENDKVIKEKELCYNEKYSTEFTDKITYSSYSIELDHPLIQVKEDIENIEDLDGLDCVEILILDNMGIYDISFLSNFKNLKVLSLKPRIRQGFLIQDPISDISPISNLNNLKVLNLEFSKPKDLSPVSELKNLEKLYLSYTGISDNDTKHLAGLKKLKVLELQGTHLSDLSFLKQFSELKELSLGISEWGGIYHFEEQSFSDISVLSELNSLEKLHINNAPELSDISSLKKLTNLELLIFNKTLIYDISTISDLKNLKKLYIINSPVFDISAISSLYNLKIVHLERVPVSDIYPLSYLLDHNLEHIRLQQLLISDVPFSTENIDAYIFLPPLTSLDVMEKTFWWFSYPEELDGADIIINKDFICGNDFTDARDGEIYKTVKIDSRCLFVNKGAFVFWLPIK